MAEWGGGGEGERRGGKERETRGHYIGKTY